MTAPHDGGPAFPQPASYEREVTLDHDYEKHVFIPQGGGRGGREEHRAEVRQCLWEAGVHQGVHGSGEQGTTETGDVRMCARHQG